MTPPLFFIRAWTLAANADRGLNQNPIWTWCVRDVLAGIYPTITPDYYIMDGLSATPDDLSPTCLALDRVSFDRSGVTVTLTIEATYEDHLRHASTDPLSRPVTPKDYGPAVVVYQLTGEVTPEVVDVQATVRAFAGSLDEYVVSGDFDA